jgi:RNA polymerase sigma factor (TIGR02999 family)
VKDLKGHSTEGVTQLLTQWSKGDEAALNKLMPLVYDELHKLARAHMRREHGERTLQPTALVNEAYVKLVAQREVSWQSRAQFFGMAATLMRNILVDYARRRNAAKRGGGEYRISFSRADQLGQKPDMEILALDDALKEFAAAYPEHSRVVELRFFGGLTIEETSEVVGSSHATIERQWRFARAWLRRELSNE